MVTALYCQICITFVTSASTLEFDTVYEVSPRSSIDLFIFVPVRWFSKSSTSTRATSRANRTGSRRKGKSVSEVEGTRGVCKQARWRFSLLVRASECVRVWGPWRRTRTYASSGQCSVRNAASAGPSKVSPATADGCLPREADVS